MIDAENLPPKRGYRWNGNRWVSIRADRAVKTGAVVAFILVCAIAAVLLVARLLPVLP